MKKISLDTSIVRLCSSLNDNDLDVKIYRWGPTHFVMNWEKKWHPKKPRNEETKALADLAHFKPIIDAALSNAVSLNWTPVVKYELGNNTLLSFQNIVLKTTKIVTMSGSVPPHLKNFYPPNMSGVVPSDFNPIMNNFERKRALKSMIESISDDNFQSLKSSIDKKHLVDVYILWLSNKNGCDVLLTSDYKFQNYAANCKVLKTLNCKVMRPFDLNTQYQFGEIDKTWTQKTTNIVHQQRVYSLGTYVFSERMDNPTVSDLLNVAQFLPAKQPCDLFPSLEQIAEALEKCLKN